MTSPGVMYVLTGVICKLSPFDALLHAQPLLSLQLYCHGLSPFRWRIVNSVSTFPTSLTSNIPMADSICSLDDGEDLEGSLMASPNEETTPFFRSTYGDRKPLIEKHVVPENHRQDAGASEHSKNGYVGNHDSHHGHYSSQQHLRRNHSQNHLNGTGGRGKSLNPMVMVGIIDEEQYSSSSPFHSATEDFGLDNDHDRDRDPLIKPPAKTSQFHQILSSKLKKLSSTDLQSSSGIVDKDEDGRKCSVGIFLAAVSCVFFATSALIVKVSKLHPMELLGFRGLIQGILVTPVVISTHSSLIPKGSKSLLLARAILGSVALVMSFASIHWIPLADAATVIFTSPVFVSIFACICLSEMCGWFDVAMIALTLIGVLLVSKPSFNFINTGSWTSIGGTFCGLAAAMLTALAFIVLRQLKHIHYSVTVFWFSFVLASFGAVLTIALDGFVMPSDLRSISECVGIGICGFFGQILLTKALQLENAGPVAVARTMDIVLAFFYQITLLHDTPDWKSYLGSVLVVSCVLLTAFRRWYRERCHKFLNHSSFHLHISTNPRSPASNDGAATTGPSRLKHWPNLNE
ncbi:unnamed protein product [Allacma fusca]|uniref:EamA domain-containing protein n=1 Tax=Allacma fusca TaxID=39272 RepID=A0A8J2JV55_9HEXA|nr:unnamed protein product [Allacma fusca]